MLLQRQKDVDTPPSGESSLVGRKVILSSKGEGWIHGSQMLHAGFLPWFLVCQWQGEWGERRERTSFCPTQVCYVQVSLVWVTWVTVAEENKIGSFCLMEAVWHILLSTSLISILLHFKRIWCGVSVLSILPSQPSPKAGPMWWSIAIALPAFPDFRCEFPLALAYQRLLIYFTNCPGWCYTPAQCTQLLLAGDLIPFLPSLEGLLCFKLKLLWQSWDL